MAGEDDPKSVHEELLREQAPPPSQAETAPDDGDLSDSKPEMRVFQGSDDPQGDSLHLADE